MSVHYKQPVLLIEFEENKSFSLEVRPTQQILLILFITYISLRP